MCVCICICICIYVWWCSYYNDTAGVSVAFCFHSMIVISAKCSCLSVFMQILCESNWVSCSCSLATYNDNLNIFYNLVKMYKHHIRDTRDGETDTHTHRVWHDVCCCKTCTADRKEMGKTGKRHRARVRAFVKKVVNFKTIHQLNCICPLSTWWSRFFILTAPLRLCQCQFMFICIMQSLFSAIKIKH